MTYAEDFDAETARLRAARLKDETAAEWRRLRAAYEAVPLTDDFIDDIEQGFFARARKEGRWF